MNSEMRLRNWASKRGTRCVRLRSRKVCDVDCCWTVGFYRQTPELSSSPLTLCARMVGAVRVVGGGEGRRVSWLMAWERTVGTLSEIQSHGFFSPHGPFGVCVCVARGRHLLPSGCVMSIKKKTHPRASPRTSFFFFLKEKKSDFHFHFPGK